MNGEELVGQYEAWYWETATEAERQLAEKCAEYEEAYFEGFLLLPDSILRDYMCIEAETEPGKWVKQTREVPPIGGKQVADYWKAVFSTGKTPDGAPVLAAPVNLIKLIQT